MNQEVKNLLKQKDSWIPTTYTILDLSQMLEISLEEACRITRMVNGFPHDGTGEIPTVAHHDLVEYLEDLDAISENSFDLGKVSKGVLWLAYRGWFVDINYRKFRYVDPEDFTVRYTLRSALRIELDRVHGGQLRDLEPETNSAIINVEWANINE